MNFFYFWISLPCCWNFWGSKKLVARRSSVVQHCCLFCTTYPTLRHPSPDCRARSSASQVPSSRRKSELVCSRIFDPEKPSILWRKKTSFQRKKMMTFFLKIIETINLFTTKFGPIDNRWQFSISRMHNSVVMWSSVASSLTPHLMSTTCKMNFRVKGQILSFHQKSLRSKISDEIFSRSYITIELTTIKSVCSPETRVHVFLCSNPSV